MIRETIAYCWSSGVIGFGETAPELTTEIARGKDNLVRLEIAHTSRLAYDNTTILVPGMLEAVTQQDKDEALAGYLLWLKKRERAGFKVAVEVPACAG